MFGTSRAVETSELWFAKTNTAGPFGLTFFALGAVTIAWTSWTVFAKVVVPIGTFVTQRSVGEVGLAKARTGNVLTTARVSRVRTTALGTCLQIGGFLVGRSVEAELTSLTVDAFSVVFAVNTDTTARTIAMNVNGESLCIDFFIIVAFCGMVITIAFFTFVWVSDCRGLPFFLDISWTTPLALISTRIVLTLTLESSFAT